VQLDKVTGAAVDYVWNPVTAVAPIILQRGDTITAQLSGAPTTTNPVAHAEFHDFKVGQ
jgi:hypothetical protein